MSRFESGVRAFVDAYAYMLVHFPVDEKGREYVRCRECPYLSSNERMCQLNKQPVHFPERSIGPYCPLEFIDNEEKEERP